jgi:hypothetical protein
MPIGFAEQQSGQHEVGARPNLFKRDAGRREAKEEQDELHGHRPPMFELIERVDLARFSPIEQPKVSRAVWHEGHDWHQRQGRMKAAIVERGPRQRTRTDDVGPEAVDAAAPQPERSQ